ncbi:MAG: GWxTD domain-containing protein [Ignavibacteria bacterium]|nr:GWxTD domain-containing protein [Ignavibacteria bacterium]
MQNQYAWHTLSLTVAVFMASASATGQSGKTAPTTLVDVLCFKGQNYGLTTQTDIYVAVPYTSLQFSEFDNQYAAQYQVNVTVRDTVGRKVFDTSATRSIIETSYNVTLGSTGKADNVVFRTSLQPGFYRREVHVKDKFSNREFSSTDSLTVADFSIRPSISSIMYVSQVEQRGDRYSITPYIGSTIWNSDLTLFAFFEIYLDKQDDTVAFSWSIKTSDEQSVSSGMGEPIPVRSQSFQTFLPLIKVDKVLPGTYTLKIVMHDVVNNVVDSSIQLASQSRPYIVPRTFAGSVLSDLNKAIKHLAYVAEQREIDYINSSTNQADMQQRFEEFWKRHDPSPTTVRNEAFEEYYTRIETANKRFTSYTEGWLTDMGMVYIIFGEPRNIDRYTGQTGTTVAVRWTYSNGATYLFDDSTGFGDFRLRVPLPMSIKYRFK